mgnify:CR=1 FL=1
MFIPGLMGFPSLSSLMMFLPFWIPSGLILLRDFFEMGITSFSSSSMIHYSCFFYKNSSSSSDPDYQDPYSSSTFWISSYYFSSHFYSFFAQIFSISFPNFDFLTFLAYSWVKNSTYGAWSNPNDYESFSRSISLTLNTFLSLLRNTDQMYDTTAL